MRGPSLPAKSLSQLTRCRCSASSIPIRSFSTSSPLSAIGPVSPKFIEVPTTPQPQARQKLDIKGTLPPPRNLFPARAIKKTSKGYLNAVTKEPKERPEPANEYAAWKRRMAASRRGNLREGLVELYKRKKDHDGAVAARSKTRQEERGRRLHAPQREDERLTDPTIKEANRILQSGPIPDPNRETRVAEKAARVQAKEAAREEQRKNALHTLYMQARSFITTEEQLDAKIEEIFTEARDGESDSVWDNLDAPPTVQDMLSAINKTESKAVRFHSGPAQLTGQRMKKLAEELTGGKMD
ncbi:hypothetical protein N431DRAFT_417819 [Stipitochalara longipes BDJ]|nr:hypothetical protein N431DRAFT_417819 [Stipitochalara longipes BDJ]